MLMQSLDTNALVTTVKSSKPGSSASPIRTEDVNNDIPYIGPNDEIDPTILSMAGTITVPSREELELDPRLASAFEL